MTLYVDAGNPLWCSPAEMAQRLARAGIDRADGFCLNVSNFVSTPNCLGYGDELCELLSGKHYIIDTSRNGDGPTARAEWCNPSGRALGPAPLTPTKDANCDAFFWIKSPGDSDGPCNDAPPYGWCPDCALELARLAAW